MTYYDLLGVSPDASQPEIEAAFERESKAYNSGTFADPAQATESAKRVAEAYRVLHDPKRREEYNRVLTLQQKPVEDGAITEEEFRSWLEPGRTITEGIAAKIAAEKTRREKLNQEIAAKTRAQERNIRRGLATTLLLLAALGAFVAWRQLDNAGYIPRDEMTIVYSPNWQYGEYKACTTLNGAKQQNVLCDGGAPSGRIEDGKVFNVRFWGKTYDEGKPSVYSGPSVAPAIFYWNCRKNGGVSPSYTCKRASE
jgi:curved DNA-binding protein CbpA